MKILVFANFSKYWFQRKKITRLLEFIKLLTKPTRDFFFFFTIYQNYTLVLRNTRGNKELGRELDAVRNTSVIFL